MRSRSSAIIVVSLLAAGLLTGCAAEADAEPSVTSTASPTPTPTSAPPASAIMPFSGSCANMVDPAEVDSLTGDTGAVFARSGAPAIAAQVIGGLSCAVYQERSVLSVTALPSIIVPATDAAAESSSCVETPEPVCSVVVRSGDVWIDVRVDSYEFQALADPVDALSDFASRIADRAAQYPAPVAAERAEGWWLTPPACDTIFTESGLVDALGSTFEPGFPGHMFEDPAWLVLLEARGGFRACDWYQGLGLDEAHPHTVRFIALPGSAATVDAFATEMGGTSEPIVVPGADEAALVVLNDGITGERLVLVARVGTNLLRVETREAYDTAPTDTEEIVSIAAAVLERLSAQR